MLANPFPVPFQPFGWNALRDFAFVVLIFVSFFLCTSKNLPLGLGGRTGMVTPGKNVSTRDKASVKRSTLKY